MFYNVFDCIHPSVTSIIMILHYIITYINDYIIKIWKITNNDILNLNFEVNLFYQATHKIG